MIQVAVWKKSTKSGPWTDNCAEVSGSPDGMVLVRDTKDKGEGPILRFTKAEWVAFVGGVKAGEFDID